jgi:hypothetical protein
MLSGQTVAKGIVGPAGFEENRGQVTTTSGEPAPFVKFRYAQGNVHIFILGNGLACQFERLHFPDGYEEARITARRDPRQHALLQQLRKEVRLETFRMDMILDGAGLEPRITTRGRSADHANYYTHDALHVHRYEEVIFHDVYPGIDWSIRITADGIKYDFIVHPGADPDRIKLRFEHHEELYIDASGRLIHGNRMGRFTELRPVSFQGGKEIATAFQLEGDILRFSIDDFDRSRRLVIDPDRIWGTYYGGTSPDDGWEVATDGEGNAYLAGSTGSTGAIASGGHQNIYGQGQDAFLVKFNADGMRQWGTYYGGTEEDMGWSCAVDRTGNVYLSGSTASASAIAIDGHQNTYGGGLRDAFLVKFGPDGERIWATYYGGGHLDDGFHCTTDTLNYVYLTGVTRSETGIAFNGHLNESPGSDNDNGFVVKFDSLGNRIWATYYGGAGLDNAQAVAVDLSGNVYVAGSTLSFDGIAADGHQNSHGGGTFDAYLVKFDSVGTRQWATYFGGPGLDQGWGCAVDHQGGVYLAGLTASTSSIAYNGHQGIHGGGGMDGFLVKFDSSGTRSWATYYGGDLADEAYACATDPYGDVFLAGLSQSSTGIASGGHQNENASPGTADAFLAKFDGAGLRLWGTYYGGTASDAGFSCASDGLGSVYLAGLTNSATGISDEGHQNEPGGLADAFLAKFEGGISTAIDGMGPAMAPSLALYPNPLPAGGSVLSIAGVPHGRITIVLYDALGRMVFMVDVLSAGSTIEIPIDLSVGAGLYTIIIDDGRRRMKGRVVVR